MVVLPRLGADAAVGRLPANSGRLGNGPIGARNSEALRERCNMWRQSAVREREAESLASKVALVIASVISFALLEGCATQSLEESYRQPLTNPMHNILATLKGQPSKVAFQRLNYPDDQKIIADRKVYIWRTPNDDCVIRLFVDQEEVVQNGDWRGSITGCSIYIQRFNNQR